jgi:carboxypeptidase C (cathepsin A)
LNQEKGWKTPLAGLAIGNGIYDPNIQFPSVANYSHVWGIIDSVEYQEVQANVSKCLSIANHASTLEQLDYAADLCVNTTNNVYSVFGGNIFQYNVYELDGNAFNDMTNQLQEYFAQSDIPQSLHTQGEPWKSSDGTSVPNPVYNNLKYDIVLNNSAEIVFDLLSGGLPILFYNGQLDGSVCNNLGNSACLNQMNWKGEWINLPKTAWGRTGSDGCTTCGYVKQSSDKLLTYFVVSDSGHLVPMDQPQTSLNMLRNWIENGTWDNCGC